LHLVEQPHVLRVDLDPYQSNSANRHLMKFARYFPGGLGGSLGGYSGQHLGLQGSCRAADEDRSTNEGNCRAAPFQ
jgi:hypothetical protein